VPQRRSVIVPRQWSRPSGCNAAVATQQPSESLVYDYLPGGGVGLSRGYDEIVAESLVGPFVVEVGVGARILPMPVGM
jgi:hypothetical protein